MKSVRDQLLSAAQGLLITGVKGRGVSRQPMGGVQPAVLGAGGAGKEGPPPEPPPASGVLQRLLRWATDPGNRRQVFLGMWVVMVTLLLGFTAILLLLFHGDLRLHIVTIAWALFFGIAVLFFMPSKAVTALFGGILGIGASKLGTGASLLSKANEVVKAITKVFIDSIQPSIDSLRVSTADSARVVLTGGNSHLVQLLVWEFFIVLILMCLPAFWRD